MLCAASPDWPSAISRRADSQHDLHGRAVAFAMRGDALVALTSTAKRRYALPVRILCRAESWSRKRTNAGLRQSKRKANFLAQMTPERSKDLPDVPAITEFASSPMEKDALKFIFSSFEAGRPFGAPPGIPRDRLTTLRRAFDATMKDAQFLAHSKKINLDVDPITGEQT
jgi:hypothetical protein